MIYCGLLTRSREDFKEPSLINNSKWQIFASSTTVNGNHYKKNPSVLIGKLPRWTYLDHMHVNDEHWCAFPQTLIQVFFHFCQLNHMNHINSTTTAKTCTWTCASKGWTQSWNSLKIRIMLYVLFSVLLRNEFISHWHPMKTNQKNKPGELYSFASHIVFWNKILCITIL